MTLKLKNKNVIPYGGQFAYKCPFSGKWIYGTNWDMLIRRIREQRKANDFPIGLDFEQEIENQLCISYPDECEYFNPKIPRRKRLAIGDVIRGSRVMLAFYQKGKPLVDRAEAERRAQICKTCMYNADFTRPCAGICQELRDVIGVITNNMGTPYDKDLQVCHICSCYNAAQVWLTLDILDSGLTDDMRDQFNSIEWCWKKTRPQTS